MELKEIEAALKLMEQHKLSEFEWKRGDDSIRLSSTPATTQASLGETNRTVQQDISQATQQIPIDRTQERAGGASDQENVVEVRSPFVGTFYKASAPDAEPFVKVGSRVTSGDTLCIVEAMKLMNEIEAERGGVISKVLVENEQPVEFNQVLFLMEI